MSIYITRHGQTDWNVEHKVQGKADIELNSRGIEQAGKTRENLSKEKIDLIICSPLQRAKQTAEVINSERYIPIIFDERISERDVGEFEGRKQEDFDFKRFWSYKSDIKYEKAENIKEFFSRIYAFLDDIKSQYSGKNILLVSHGGVSIPVNCYFNGIPENDELLLKLVLENCEYSKYEFQNIKEDDFTR